MMIWPQDIEVSSQRVAKRGMLETASSTSSCSLVRAKINYNSQEYYGLHCWWKVFRKQGIKKNIKYSFPHLALTLTRKICIVQKGCHAIRAVAEKGQCKN